MKILHTSDWHLGRSLYGRQRYEEFGLFLDWLCDTIIKENIDVLLISGDIFDTTTPGNRAQELYYNFLFKISSSPCRHIIITSGNHDSPSFLSAPKDILKFMNVSVVTSSSNIKDEVIVLKDKNGVSEAVICAIPYLRDRDIRLVEPGESMDDKNLKLVEAIKSHYREVCDYGLSIKDKDSPIIAMGHLFATGGKTMDGDGVRELYVGSLAHIGADLFPGYLDYVALGHLHVPQKIGGDETIRYSGSPIPMGFGEANQNKIVLIADFNRGETAITEVSVPRFQELIRVVGNRDEILNRVKELKESNIDVWLEIEFKGDGIVGNLQEDIFNIIEGSSIEVRIIKNSFMSKKVLENRDEIQDLDELSVEEVFKRCLDIYNIDDAERPLLYSLYSEIVASTLEEDINL